MPGSKNARIKRLRKRQKELEALEDAGLDEDTRYVKRNLSKPKMRLLYMCLNVAVITLVMKVDHTELWVHETPFRQAERDTVANGEYMFSFYFLICLSWIAFFCVQGSDPGYLDADLLKTAGQDNFLLSASEDVVEMETISVEAKSDSKEIEEEMAEKDGAAFAQAQVQNMFARMMDEELVPLATERDAGTCEVCRITKPLRSKHCRICNRCVSTFDHHCVMLGTCIGEKNHCKFWWFLLFQLGALVHAAVTVWTGFRWTYQGYGIAAWFSYNGFAFGVSLVVWLCLLMIFSLFGFHTFFAMSGLTGSECMRSDKLRYLRGTRDFDLPYSNGLLNNLRQFCCIRDGTLSFFGKDWTPTLWKPPGYFNRQSDDVLENCWENKYWSCC